MKTFTDSGGGQWILCFGLCKCYVWTTVWEYGERFGGRCVRCGEGIQLLQPVITDKSEAKIIFEELHGRRPEEQPPKEERCSVS